MSVMTSGPKRPYSDANFDAAERMVSNLFDEQASKFILGYRITQPGLRHTAVEAADFHLDDILADVGKYQQQYTYCVQHDLPIFCVEDVASGGSPRPLVLGVEEAQTLYQSGHNPAKALEELGISLSPTAKLVPYPAAAALGFFKFGMSDFVAARLTFFGAGPAKRYPFTVTTNTPNLNVYWTPAGNLISGKVFGYPSRTVKGALAAGNYSFGAGLPGGTATYDMAASYYVPSLSLAHLNI
jgi:hypothetical protein